MSSSFVIKRVLISLLVGLIIGIVINEVTFYFLRETARAPKRVEIVIPAGTAEKIARGESFSAIPNNMTFVVGDKLVVINQDSENHELGPLWIPAGGSASMMLDTADKYSYECSFQPQSMFGVDVHEPLTFTTRVYGVFYSGVPLGILIAIYSILIPTKEKKNVPA